MKNLIDQVIAQEFNAPDLEFAFSAEASVDPQQQEAILSSYTSKGIPTINEARAALGRDPLAEPAANKPMALTGAGYVLLGQTAQQAGKSVGQIAKFNPHHDERGRFATVEVAGGAVSRDKKRRERTAQGGESEEEENRGAEESNDPLAEVRQQEWADAFKTLEQLDPKNPNLSYATAPDWVPTDQDIANLNAEIDRVAPQRVKDFVMPGGIPIGQQGGGRDIREVAGGAQAAQAAFDYMSVGGTDVTPLGYNGTLIELPHHTGYVGLRSSRSGSAVDINVRGVPYRTLHYP